MNIIEAAKHLRSACIRSNTDHTPIEQSTIDISANLVVDLLELFAQQINCNFPSCKSDKYQSLLAEDVHTELIGKPKHMSDTEIDAITIAQWGKDSNLQAHRAYARAIEKQIIGVSE